MLCKTTDTQSAFLGRLHQKEPESYSCNWRKKICIFNAPNFCIITLIESDGLGILLWSLNRARRMGERTWWQVNSSVDLQLLAPYSWSSGFVLLPESLQKESLCLSPSVFSPLHLETNIHLQSIPGEGQLWDPAKKYDMLQFLSLNLISCLSDAFLLV